MPGASRSSRNGPCPDIRVCLCVFIRASTRAPKGKTNGVPVSVTRKIVCRVPGCSTGLSRRFARRAATRDTTTLAQLRVTNLTIKSANMGC